MLAFKISFFSTEKGVNCFKFATTLEKARKIARDLTVSGKGKNCKITPLKLK